MVTMAVDVDEDELSRAWLLAAFFTPFWPTTLPTVHLKSG
jgi:hypothetical protein